MGNHHTHESSKRTYRYQPYEPSAQFPTHNGTHNVKSYLQPTTQTLNEYLRKQHDHEWNPTGTTGSLRPPDYRDAYKHLRELSEKHKEHVEEPLDVQKSESLMRRGASSPRQKTAQVTTKHATSSHCEERRPKIDESTGRVVGVANGLGDRSSPVSRSSSKSSSDSYAVHVDVRNSTRNLSTDEQRSTPYDRVAKVGDTSSASLSSSTSGEIHLPNERCRHHGRKYKSSKSEATTSTVLSNVRSVRSAYETHGKYHEGKRNGLSNIPSHDGVCFEKGDLHRSQSACNRDSNILSANNRITPVHLGFQTYPDGTVAYTAFVCSGPCGVPSEGWLNELQKRASRHLTGLRRQYRCTIDFDERIISYRGLFVHALVLTGQNQSDIVRCRNALPSCIEKYLITPYALHGTTTLRRVR